ncbi:hypothetical protein [Ramlibacter rhizophilus]|uniref:Uncharacterized protein n=1 Tax=Ramlibacter rhizophilus TaxID=1781167 RepID=A0A4Z0C224_9BURK|nr:hypothetical protein [Ramlibacter rhizophilus]TFZ05002.1 hypothetical protein EZ242_04445 [Ramlibacter rhizophilus]
MITVPSPSWPLALLAAALAAPAGAQQAPVPAPLPGHSPLQDYQRFQDAPVRPWKESNDTVGRIGGWRAYAREAQAPEPAAPGGNAPGTANPPQAPAPSRPAGAHRHH